MRGGILLTAVLGLGLGQGQPQDPKVVLPPWHAAVAKGDAAEVQRLLAQGQDVNARLAGPARGSGAYLPTPFIKNATALHIAAAQGSPELLDVLLKAKPALELQDDYSCTPLYYAARRGDVAVLERLVKAGAKVNEPADTWQHTAVAVAAEVGKLEAVQRL